MNKYFLVRQYFDNEIPAVFCIHSYTEEVYLFFLERGEVVCEIQAEPYEDAIQIIVKRFALEADTIH